MRALLDVNVLIALLDQDHSMHAQALRWFAARAGDGWASCPITQNGCVRIMSHELPQPVEGRGDHGTTRRSDRHRRARVLAG